MKIAMFGGSFNPVHNGHVSLVEAALNDLCLDKLIVVPAKYHPFGEKKYLISDSDRLAMLHLVFDGMDRVEISTYELEKDEVSYSINTLKYLKEKYNCEVSMITGTDAFISIERWASFEEIARDFSFIIGTRPGYREEELKAVIAKMENNYQAKIERINNKTIEVSSSNLKQRIANAQSLEDLLPASVEEYINKNNLYK